MQVLEKYFKEFTPIQVKQFGLLHELYKEWNNKINVISRKDIDNFYLHHVLHSLTIAAHFRFTGNMQVMDLGSGGGFPGLPLAIYFPDTEFLLVDSINKKLHVANHISSAIGLLNIKTIHKRVEDLKDQKFDVITSRAVASLNDLWNWSKPLLRKNKRQETDIPNGLICLKGGDLAKEVQESNCKPFVWEISKIFQEEYFREKYLLYQPLLKNR